VNIEKSSLPTLRAFRSTDRRATEDDCLLILTAERLALFALDRDLAALQASSRTAFFNAIAVVHEPIWPPTPFDTIALDWARLGLEADPEAQGWFGWAIVANGGERAPPRIVGAAALIGRPDEEGDVELALGMLPEFKGRGYGAETVRTLANWALKNGATRVIVHLDAEDFHAVRVMEKSGFIDTREPPYPGVARYALSAA
jgi:RimJ/RimL family protein N-acetyltransferase